MGKLIFEWLIFCNFCCCFASDFKLFEVLNFSVLPELHILWNIVPL